MLCTVRTLEGPCSRRAAYRVLNLRNKWVGRVCLAHASRSELEGVMGGCRLRSLYCSTCGAVLSDEEGDRCHACFQFFNQESTVALRTPEQDRPLATLSLDAEAAAWRLAGSQFVKLARDPIVALLSRHLAPGDESLRARIAAFLGTELGASLLAAMLSVPLPGLRGRAAKAAAVQVFRAFGADLDGPENLWSIVLVEYQDGARVGRHAYSAASSTWRKLPTDPEPPHACPRCGGHGIESALDAYCYACGRLGKRAEAYWRARGKTDG